ncbi:branched-chain amino acid ABC transporter permease [Paenirhodobacter enshiensis]|uniref:branched-chain amino acid ABC transporter permease n=1 Tax=Paenirhodobacter enshiensis TaxID=1105367 RepID=UPI0035B0E269
MSTRQPDAAKGGKFRAPLLFAVMAALIVMEGLTTGWDSALVILNMGIISAIMALGLNMQWGYAGLFNSGVVGFTALGGLAPVLISMPPTGGAMSQGGWQILGALLIAILALVVATKLNHRLHGAARAAGVIAALVIGFVLFRAVFDPAVARVQAINPASQGYLGGLGLPVLLAWPVGAVLAAAAAWAIGKTSLGLRSDYLAIATLGIGEIIVAVLKNEEWLDRGVLNVTGIPRPWPVPYEVDLQADPGFVARMQGWGIDPVTGSTLTVKLIYMGLFGLVLALLLWGAQLALKSPWGRMMRAIRDNETAAAAMGKNVTRRHLQIFMLGAAVMGLAGAMMITLDGQMTPASYNPLRYTFLILVMVVVGGSGNNWGSVLGAVLVWFLWIKAEAWGPEIMNLAISHMSEGPLRQHLFDAAPQMRVIVMGLLLLLVLRFSPRGLLPEK